MEKPSLDSLYEKAKGICFVCAKFVDRAVASREHIIPVSLGGTDEESNLTISHQRCNNNRGNGYKPIHSQFHRLDEKNFTELPDYGLLLQVVPQDKGAYIILSRKKKA